MKTKPFEFPSLKAFAGAMGVPVSAARAAKNAGCPGFSTNGRVDGVQVCGWLLTKGKKLTPQVSLEDARARLTNAKATIAEREAAAGGDGQLCSVEAQARALMMFCHFLRTSLPAMTWELASRIDVNDPSPIASGLHTTLRTWLATSAATIATGAWNDPLPAWAVKAIDRGIAGDWKPELSADFSERIAAIKGLMALSAGEIFSTELRERIAKQST